MQQSVFVVDAFANKPFSGNPAAVCLLEAPIPENEMRAIAAEMNLSETAFVITSQRPYSLRWFTPTSEVKLCGHATLASAHVIWEQALSKDETLEFSTLSGILKARRLSSGIQLDFPREPVSSCDFPPELVESLGVVPIFTGKTDVRYFAELSSEKEVRDLNPDISKLVTCPPGRVVVTAISDNPSYDFISRYFAPGVGVPEDPVTGSTHCALAVYWAEKLGKTSFHAFQASARGGELKAEIAGPRVLLTGSAITMLRGQLSY